MRCDNNQARGSGAFEVITGTHRASVCPIKGADDEMGFVFHPTA